MAQIDARPKIELSVVLRLDEEEARAIDALVGYGDDAFIRVFKESLGAHYLEQHEEGLRRFFQTTRQLLPGILSSADTARKMFNGKMTP
jgi:hypothetical protein